MSVLSSDVLHFYGFTNVSQAVAYANGYCFYVWFDASFNVRVSRVTLADGTKSTSSVLYTALDTHEDAHVLIDPTDNKVVVISGGYLFGGNSYGKIWKSTAAYGTTFGTGVALPSAGGRTNVVASFGSNTVDNSYNYPAFFADGTLVIVTQWQGDSLASGDEVWVYKYAGDGTGKTATQLASGAYGRKLFDDRGGAASPATFNRTYVSPLTVRSVSGTERLGMTFTMYRPNPGGTSYSYGSGAADWGVGYLYTDDKGTTWKKVDGTTVTGSIDCEASVADTTLFAHAGAALRGGRVALKADGKPIVVGRPSTLSLGGSTYSVSADSHTVFEWSGSAWTSTNLDSRTTGPAADFGYPPAVTYDPATDTTYVASNRSDSGTYATDQLNLDYRVGSGSWVGMSIPETTAESTYAHATPWSFIDDAGVYNVVWNRFGRTFTGQASDTFATVMWDRPVLLLATGYGNNTNTGYGDATVETDSASLLVLPSSSAWEQVGSSIFVRTVDEPCSVQATVTGTAGGLLRFAGTDADKFDASLNGTTWASPIDIPEGTVTVYLRVTPDAPGVTLTAEIGVPV